jgi:hypothetical protein
MAAIPVMSWQAVYPGASGLAHYKCHHFRGTELSERLLGTAHCVPA